MTMTARTIDDGALDDAPPPSQPRASAVYQHHDIVLELVCAETGIELLPEMILVHQPLVLLQNMHQDADPLLLAEKFIRACAESYILAFPSPMDCTICIVSLDAFTNDSLRREVLLTRLTRLRETCERYIEEERVRVEAEERARVHGLSVAFQDRRQSWIDETHLSYDRVERDETDRIKSDGARELEILRQEYEQRCALVNQRMEERIRVVQQSRAQFEALRMEQIVEQQRTELEAHEKNLRRVLKNGIDSAMNPLATLLKGVIRLQKREKNGE